VADELHRLLVRAAAAAERLAKLAPSQALVHVKAGLATWLPWLSGGARMSSNGLDEGAEGNILRADPIRVYVRNGKWLIDYGSYSQGSYVSRSEAIEVATTAAYDKRRTDDRRRGRSRHVCSSARPARRRLASLDSLTVSRLQLTGLFFQPTSAATPAAASAFAPAPVVVDPDDPAVAQREDVEDLAPSSGSPPTSTDARATGARG